MTKNKKSRKTFSEWFESKTKPLQYIIAGLLVALAFVGIPALVITVDAIYKNATDHNGRLYDAIAKKTNDNGYKLLDNPDEPSVVESCLKNQRITLDVEPIDPTNVATQARIVVLQCVSQRSELGKEIVIFVP